MFAGILILDRLESNVTYQLRRKMFRLLLQRIHTLDDDGKNEASDEHFRLVRHQALQDSQSRSAKFVIPARVLDLCCRS